MSWEDPVQYCIDWFKDIPIDTPDKKESEYCKTALAHLGALLYDNPALQRLSKRDKFYHVRKSLGSIYNEILERGFIGFTKRMNDLGHSFLRSFSENETTPSFESQELVSSPIYSAINYLYDHQVQLLTGDKSLIRWILTWHLFLAKLPITRSDLYDTAETAWIERQREVAERDFYPIGLMTQLRSIVSWLIEIDDVEMPGKHGPGTTSIGAKDIVAKNHGYMPTIQTRHLTSYDPERVANTLLSSPRDSKLMLVPKDCKSLRPITAEAPEMQYAQQSLKLNWYETNDGTKDLPIRHFVRYKDQRRSQVRALLGSKVSKSDSRPATIDLSSASDYLSVEVVCELFSGHLLSKVLAGRSWASQTSTGKVELGMYAGMGSAITFPVQTTVFTAVAILATLRSLHRCSDDHSFNFEESKFEYLCGDGFKPYYRKYARAIQVYGDDIIVPEVAVADTLDILRALGLHVNESKSFSGPTPIRESCGIFACNGHDITPLRYRTPVIQNGGRIDFAAYEGQRLLINRSFQYGYGTLYRSLIFQLKTAKPYMSSKDIRRYNRRAGRDLEAPISVADLILWESYRGEDDYIGFISIEDSKPDTSVLTYEKKKGKFFLTSKPVDPYSDQLSDYYHLSQTYRKMVVSDSQSENHGKLDRGIRFKVGVAVINPVVRADGRIVRAWGLAPKLDRGIS